MNRCCVCVFLFSAPTRLWQRSGRGERETDFEKMNLSMAERRCDIIGGYIGEAADKERK